MQTHPQNPVKMTANIFQSEGNLETTIIRVRRCLAPAAPEKKEAGSPCGPTRQKVQSSQANSGLYAVRS
jgi:hypothetical protein